MRVGIDLLTVCSLLVISVESTCTLDATVKNNGMGSCVQDDTAALLQNKVKVDASMAELVAGSELKNEAVDDDDNAEDNDDNPDSETDCSGFTSQSDCGAKGCSWTNAFDGEEIEDGSHKEVDGYVCADDEEVKEEESDALNVTQTTDDGTATSVIQDQSEVANTGTWCSRRRAHRRRGRGCPGCPYARRRRAPRVIAKYSGSLKGKVATQSSTAHGGSASRAIDGNGDSWWSSRSCTHTPENGNNPWWQVDLGSPTKMSAIRITNRGDCCSDRLSPFTVFVDGKPCAKDVAIKSETKIVPCVSNGQVVRVQVLKKTALTICEFEVIEGTSETTCGGSNYLNTFSSRAQMEAAGWKFDWDDAYDWKPSGPFGNGVAQTSYFGFKHPGAGTISLVLQGSGSLTLDYGNPWKDGIVSVKLNDITKSTAPPLVPSKKVTISFKHGDVLKVVEEAVMAINAISFDCQVPPKEAAPPPPSAPPATPPSPSPPPPSPREAAPSPPSATPSASPPAASGTSIFDRVDLDDNNMIDRNEWKNALDKEKTAVDAAKKSSDTTPSTKPAPTPASSNTLPTKAQQDAIVQKHNDLRVKMGASDMTKMAWDDTLASAAQKFASGCPSGHSKNRPSGVGENIAWKWATGLKLTANSDFAPSVQSWYDEFDAAGPYKNGGTFSGFNPCVGVCGHYTQVVWAAANKIGCGAAYCPHASGMGGFELVCQYGSSVPGGYGGNMGSQTLFTKGAACSSCPSGLAKCSDGLCSSGA